MASRQELDMTSLNKTPQVLTGGAVMMAKNFTIKKIFGVEKKCKAHKMSKSFVPKAKNFTIKLWRYYAEHYKGL